MKINIILTAIIVIISAIPLIFRKRFFLSIIFFLVLENLLIIFNLQARSILFVDVPVFVKYLIVFVWPLFSVYLIYYYIKTKPKK
jgi:hypothetical protein